MTKIVHKPWGREEWLALNDFYCYKRIYINAGYKTSFQYHEYKHETNYIISGTAEVWLENNNGIIEKKIMTAGDFFDVIPPKKHRVIAITDIILQEVSTPHVDDVIRINDEFNRMDGKIDAEHKTPAVLILAAGTGSRLKNLTKNINKALLPINNRAIISYIVDKFPIEYEFIIALGYKGDSLKEYCLINYPNHKFTFVDIDNFDHINSGPGYTALQCKHHLQRPFYFVVADCIIDSKIPHLDGNWLGVYPTSYPEKYSTVDIDRDDNILNFTDKNSKGYDNAFIGLASIWDFDIFWKELESNIQHGEIVSAFKNVHEYPNFKIKHLKWLDTGNLDDLNRTKEYFGDMPLSLYKLTDEIVYKENKFIKFNPNETFIKNKTERAKILKNVIPNGFFSSKYFIGYEWENGETLYTYDKLTYFVKFLDFYSEIINKANFFDSNSEEFNEFYTVKTNQRKNMFLEKFGSHYADRAYIINGIKYDSLNNILDKLKLDHTSFKMYDMFHGDLQFDNILFDPITDKFTFIDWRDSFAGNISGGDLYYDLAKLYGGCIIPYNKIKDNSFIQVNEGSLNVTYSYNISTYLVQFKTEYEKWIINNGYDLNLIKRITGLIFLNMSPLHDGKFSKMLWFKSIEILSNVDK
jgi:NDP-sugar pyrophosphorylase family protein/mannose-6-phosphate isomerase-like protein (cupin superfamily)